MATIGSNLTEERELDVLLDYFMLDDDHWYTHSTKELNSFNPQSIHHPSGSWVEGAFSVRNLRQSLVSNEKWEREYDMMGEYGVVPSPLLLTPVEGALGFVQVRRGEGLVLLGRPGTDSYCDEVCSEEFLDGDKWKNIAANVYGEQNKKRTGRDLLPWRDRIEGVSNETTSEFTEEALHVVERCCGECGVDELDKQYQDILRYVLLSWQRLLATRDENALIKYQTVCREIKEIVGVLYERIRGWYEKITREGVQDLSVQVTWCDQRITSLNQINIDDPLEIEEWIIELSLPHSCLHPSLEKMIWLHGACMRRYRSEIHNLLLHLCRFIFSGDRIISLHLTFWPLVCSNWLDRLAKHEGITTDIRDLVSSTLCHVVPKSSSSHPKPNLHWRFSFSISEYILARSRTTKQRKSYFIFKALYYNHLKEIKVSDKNLTSYFIKTLMLWMTEDKPEDWWKNNGYTDIITCLFHKLEHCLTEEELPHYFINNVNLYEQMEISCQLKRKVIAEIRKILEHLQQPSYVSNILRMLMLREDRDYTCQNSDEPEVEIWGRMVDDQRTVISKVCTLHKHYKQEMQDLGSQSKIIELWKTWSETSEVMHTFLRYMRLRVTRHHILIKPLMSDDEYIEIHSTMREIIRTIYSPCVITDLKKLMQGGGEELMKQHVDKCVEDLGRVKEMMMEIREMMMKRWKEEMKIEMKTRRRMMGRWREDEQIVIEDKLTFLVDEEIRNGKRIGANAGNLINLYYNWWK